MRTIIDLPETQIKQLDRISSREQVSRAELVRRAVSDYLEDRQKDKKALLDQCFGMLKDHPDAFDGLDGLAWQKKMRGEWDKREEDMDRRLGESRATGFHDQEQEPFDHK